MNAGRVSPSVVLAAYAEAWINGAKVVVFGDATSLLAERLIERGARHVQVYDADAARAAEASAASKSKQVSYAPLDLAGSPLQGGSFDVGVIEDLGLARQDPKALLATLGRALSRRGLALIGSRNPDVPVPLVSRDELDEPALGYYDFYDIVSQHFDEVRMLGQTPFVGYAIADFSAADASDVRIDTALLPTGAEEPELFLALASALPVEPDAFSVIQLPLADLELGGPPPRADATSDQLERAEAKIVELEAALAALAADGAREAEKYAAERARDADRAAEGRARDADRAAEGRAREAEKRELLEKIAALQADLDKREHWLAGLESRAATADERADEAQAEIEQRSSELRKAKEQLVRVEHQLEEERRAKRQLEEAARTHKQELDKLSRRADAEAQRASEAAAESKKLAARVSELSAALAESEKKFKQARDEGDEETRAELARLEGALVERAREVSRLEAALHDTERFGRQLIVELSTLKSAGEPASPGPDLDVLRQRNAELAADLEAARWTISSFEANVGGEPTASAASELGSSAPASQRRDEIQPGEPAPRGVD